MPKFHRKNQVSLWVTRNLSNHCHWLLLCITCAQKWQGIKPVKSAGWAFSTSTSVGKSPRLISRHRCICTSSRIRRRWNPHRPCSKWGLGSIHWCQESRPFFSRVMGATCFRTLTIPFQVIEAMQSPALHSKDWVNYMAPRMPSLPCLLSTKYKLCW